MRQDSAAGTAKSYVLLVCLLLVLVLVASLYHLSGGHASTRMAGGGPTSPLHKGGGADGTNVEPPPREGSVWDWRKAWEDAERLERADVARRMVREKVLEGLSFEECLSALGAENTSLQWSEDPSGVSEGADHYYVVTFMDARAEGSWREMGKPKGD